MEVAAVGAVSATSSRGTEAPGSSASSTAPGSAEAMRAGPGVEAVWAKLDAVVGVGGVVDAGAVAAGVGHGVDEIPKGWGRTGWVTTVRRGTEGGKGKPAGVVVVVFSHVWLGLGG